MRICLVTLPGLSAQYPAVFSAAPATKLMEEGKMHPVEHLINPLALQHDPTAASAGSTPPPFQVLTCTWADGTIYSYYNIQIILTPWAQLFVHTESKNAVWHFNSQWKYYCTTMWNLIKPGALVCFYTLRSKWYWPKYICVQVYHISFNCNYKFHFL